MQVIGFNFSKIMAEKMAVLNTPSVSNHIEFTNVEKENVPVLKDNEAVKLSFVYSLLYGPSKEGAKPIDEDKQAEVTFEGSMILSLEKEQVKEFNKEWKKKKIPTAHMAPLYNYILRRCSTKAIPLQDELALPTPFINLPKINPPKD